MVYAKTPLGGPAQVLEYLSRYTHRTAISNERIRAITTEEVAFSVRANDHGGKRLERLPGVEFVRRFLLHVLPGGFHRIRHYGLLANAGRRAHLARARELLGVEPKSETPAKPEAQAGHVQPTFVCRCCGAAMVVVELLARRPSIRAPPPRSGCP